MDNVKGDRVNGTSNKKKGTLSKGRKGQGNKYTNFIANRKGARGNANCKMDKTKVKWGEDTWTNTKLCLYICLYDNVCFFIIIMYIRI